jgi:hypothetical protein
MPSHRSVLAHEEKLAAGPDDSGLPMLDVERSEEFLLGSGPDLQLRSLRFGNKQGVQFGTVELWSAAVSLQSVVHLGVHNPRKIRSLPVILVMRKGNSSTKR